MDAIEDAWRALRTRLDARASELAEEVRRYPGPIARCDEQLPALIDERSRAAELARLAGELERDRAGLDADDWLARLARFASTAQPRDERSRALNGKLAEALGPRRPLP